MPEWLKQLLGLKPDIPAGLSPEGKARYAVQSGQFVSGDPKMYEPLNKTQSFPQQEAVLGATTPTVPGQFGIGDEIAYVYPELYDAILTLEAIDKEKRDLLELSGQESSYGYAGPHISDVEESYGPFHINLMAGRVDPTTGQPFTQEGAQDIQKVVQYALEEMRRTEGLGSWNPGAYDFYQEELPKRAETKLFKRGE